ncbi:hypothetical protein [Turneriella parva]|uniref:Uncharacterized protein n=1 Tax=Turneriella parva (strain ATCC BAA-1111 / DSM 21527 / NCTC 11395 / H) TaxID=869212 RepID=I4B8F3_TURPD|nr:hypothetical protein [Turneriella parva]AFM13560.1 hypothetical protein Turpa_2921 [Turneriella parva DSM 21527]
MKRILENLRTQIFANATFLRLQKTLWPEIVKFVIAGPTLIGFIVGLTRYAPGEQAFECGFQSLVFFVAYLASLTVAQGLDSLFFSSWPLVLGITRSLLAAAYLYATVRQFIEWQKGRVTFYAPVQKLRDRLRTATGNAV